MTIIATDTTPRVWPASLNCYNNEGLVGQWGSSELSVVGGI